MAAEVGRNESRSSSEAKGEEESKTTQGEEEESKTGEPEESKSEPEAPAQGGSCAVQVLTKDSEGFMDLALDLQGYCPVTITNRNGLLLNGDPTLGVLKFDSKYFVVQDQRALDEFCSNPDKVLQRLLEVARQNPELITLLELQDYFPRTALQSHLRSSRTTRAMGSNNRSDQKLFSDASTETPLHFKERHIDPSYDWNEWNIRRKALQLVNLRNCKTTSAQTERSHFRRQAETQVYLPTDKETQTGVQRGTNPPRQHTYLVGLRGLSSSKFVRSNTNFRHEKDKTIVANKKTGVVSLTYDL